MAGLRHGRPSCIRAGFRERQASVPHRVKANRRKSHMDFVEGIWWEFLDLYSDSEETPGCSAYSSPYRSLGGVTCDRLHMLKSRRPVHLQDLVVKASGRAPVSPEACDVDMQPAEASSPKARAPAARLSGSPEDSRMMEEEPPETGRHTQGRARASRPPPRLWNERDKGPKLRLSKRKLELVLTEPEQNKRKRQHAA